jgi:hypothetical protein
MQSFRHDQRRLPVVKQPYSTMQQSHTTRSSEVLSTDTV